MKFTPYSDWRWSYDNSQRLSINLNADDGQSYSFKTHYTIADLAERPAYQQPFTVHDAQLLTIYQEGLSKIRLSDGACLDLGMNGVACARFVRAASPVSRYFLPFGGGSRIENGDVASVYTKEGKVGDCLVLDTSDADGMARLMLLNQELTVNDGRTFKLGDMLRMKLDMVCAFRSVDLNRTVRYA